MIFWLLMVLYLSGAFLIALPPLIQFFTEHQLSLSPIYSGIAAGIATGLGMPLFVWLCPYLTVKLFGNERDKKEIGNIGTYYRSWFFSRTSVIGVSIPFLLFQWVVMSRYASLLSMTQGEILFVELKAYHTMRMFATVAVWAAISFAALVFGLTRLVERKAKA